MNPLRHPPFQRTLFVSGILIAAASAASTWAEDATTFPPIDVTAPAPAPAPASTLNSTELDASSLAPLRSSTSDTARLLRNVPGVSLYGAGGVSSLPAIHGLADDRLRIKVDGMDLISACPNHMMPALSYIDPTQVDSIQVFAGITPVSLGGDSIGGTIVVNSASPEFAEAGAGTLLKGRAGTFYRSNGDGNGVNLALTAAGEKLSMTYSGAFAKSDNYQAGGNFKAAGPAAVDRGWLAGDEVGSSRYEAQNHALGFALQHENHLLDLKLGWQNIPHEGFPNQRMDMTDNDSGQVNLRYSGQYQWGDLEARVYREKTQHKMNFGEDKQYLYGSPATVLAPGMPMETEGNNTGALVKASIPLSARDLLRVGSEYQRYRLDDRWPPSPATLPAGVSFGGMAPDTFWNINDGQRDRAALFAEWEAHINPQWLTLLGARYERVNMDAGPVQGYNRMMDGYKVSADAFNASDRGKSDDNLDLTALVRFTRNPAQAFEFGYAIKTRSPNLYERYSWSKSGMVMEMNNFVGDGNGYVGDINLKPEIAHTLSATADWHDPDGAWQLKVTPYFTHVEDYIDAIRCTGSGMMMNALCGGPANDTAVDQFVNLQYANQSARLYGVDVSGHFPLAESRDYGSFIATGVLNHVRGESRKTGEDLYNIMPLNAKLAVAQRLGNWTNTIEAELVDAKTRVSDARNEIKTSGYGLFHLRSSYDWQQVRLDVGVENLLDRNYDLPLGGAYVGQGATMSFNAIPWGVAVPGMGRSLYAGVTMRF